MLYKQQKKSGQFSQAQQTWITSLYQEKQQAYNHINLDGHAEVDTDGDLLDPLGSAIQP